MSRMPQPLGNVRNGAARWSRTALRGGVNRRPRRDRKDRSGRNEWIRLADPPTPFKRELPLPAVVDLSNADAGAAATISIETGTAQLEDKPLKNPWSDVVPNAPRVDPHYPCWRYVAENPSIDGSAGVLIIARQNRPTQVTWKNTLPSTAPVAWPFLDGRGPRDKMMMGMSSMTPIAPGSSVVHLHGAHVDWKSDGYPVRQPPYLPQPARAKTVLAPGAEETYTYPNDQNGGATLWFHDHVFGITALGVYTGLAGSYWIRHEDEESAGLPMTPNDREIPLVVYDRDFAVKRTLHDRQDGQSNSERESTYELRLLYGTPEQMEFYGNHVMINGCQQPRFAVKRGWYRFRIVNGSNSRFHNFWLCPGNGRENVPPFQNPDLPADHPMIQIGVDGSFLPQPVVIGDDNVKLPTGLTKDNAASAPTLRLAPGERADVLVDFGAAASGCEHLTLWSNGPEQPWNPDIDLVRVGRTDACTPGSPAIPQPVLRFDLDTESLQESGPDWDALANLYEPSVTVATDTGHVDVPDLRALGLAVPHPASADTQQESGDLTVPVAKRAVVLCEPVPGYPMFALPGDPLMLPREWEDPPTECIREGTVEIWDIVDTTGDSHPIHLHLVQFQILGRYDFDDVELTQTGNLMPASGDPSWTPPDPTELGWKDVVQVNPGQVTRLIAHFDKAGNYVYHCHILEHEDAGMMRPLVVLNRDGSLPL